jgi:Tfp pilus assembly ATPase PilU
MQTFDGEIEKLVRSGVVSKQDGLAYASNSSNLLLRLGELGGGGAVEDEPIPPAKSDSILDMIER